MGDESLTTGPRRFGKYVLLALIGQVGGTRIYRARQRSVDRLVTLTILPRQECEKPAYRMRFERQLAAASKLRHPNVLSALDAGSISGHQYIASEHVDGRRLEAILDDGEWIPAPRAARITLGVARALEHVHATGMLHRNITPRCILIGPGDHPKLRGFSYVRPRRDRAGETWFDPDDYAAQYRAPDVLLQKRLDVRSDIYSLGCVLYHLLTGRPPFSGANAAVLLQRHASEAFADPRARCLELPDSLGHVLEKAVAKDREQRYRAATDLVADLESVLAGREVAPPKRSRRWGLGRRGS